MSPSFSNVQRIVLVGTHWNVARHLALRFEPSAPCRFLALLYRQDGAPTSAAHCKPDAQVSIGFTRRGLEHVFVPKHVLSCLAHKAPAFYAGAALRAGRHLAMSGSESPTHWDEPFGFLGLDAVLSIHARSEEALAAKLAIVQGCASQTSVQISAMGEAEKLMQAPRGESFDPEDQWVHFGYRDGLSRIGIKGWTEESKLAQCRPFSIFEPGEFLLGRPQNCGATSWIAGPGSRVWPIELQRFFRDGSFGVLHKIEQDPEAFENFIAERAKAFAKEGVALDAQAIKGKLCGRHPNGKALAAAQDASADADFDYEHDQEGHQCPFGAHVRRMNPRFAPKTESAPVTQAARVRPLLRRGMPYGPAWVDTASPKKQRGILAHFFCASIEDQFEHLVAQWGDRVPMGSSDRGGARDPFFGAHEACDGPFEIPIEGAKPLLMGGFRAFTRTRGIAYLFYPSLSTLVSISKQSFWHDFEQGDE